MLAQAALLHMDDSSLSVEQLSALSRAVPDDSERKELDLYLAGQHPKHKWVAGPNVAEGRASFSLGLGLASACVLLIWSGSGDMHGRRSWSDCAWCLS